MLMAKGIKFSLFGATIRCNSSEKSLYSNTRKMIHKEKQKKSWTQKKLKSGWDQMPETDQVSEILKRKENWVDIIIFIIIITSVIFSLLFSMNISSKLYTFTSLNNPKNLNKSNGPIGWQNDQFNGIWLDKDFYIYIKYFYSHM